jgi:hypothetical protein
MYIDLLGHDVEVTGSEGLLDLIDLDRGDEVYIDLHRGHIF